MVDLRERFRQVFEPVAEVTVDEIMEASRSRHRRHRRMLGVAGGLTAAVAVVVGAVFTVGGTGPTRVRTGPGPAHPGEGAYSTSPTDSPGTHLSSTLQLSKTIVSAGGSLTGQIVVDNNTGSALHVPGCNFIFDLVLANDSYQQPAVWLLCLGSVTVPPGRSSYPVQLSALYRGCGPRSSSPCVEGQPLPPGRYQARVVEFGNSIPLPAPIAVTVTAASTGGEAAPNVHSTPSTTVLKNTRITYWGPISSSYNDPNTGLSLAPPRPGSAPAITWQQAVNPCAQPPASNNCVTPSSPQDVYLAVGSDGNFGQIGPQNTLMYVIEQAQPCSSAGNQPPDRPDPSSTTTAPKTVTCTFLAFVNATTGKAMGAMSGPGVKPLSNQ